MTRSPNTPRRGPRKNKTPIEINDKTRAMLQDYCQLNRTQIRSEIDALIQFAIETKLKATT